MARRSRTEGVTLVTTPWDVFMFVLTYMVAVFTTITAAEACNTTTVSVFETITQHVSLASGTLTITITQDIAGSNGTYSTITGITGTSTVTDIITVTGSQYASDVGIGSTTTLTSSTLATSYVNDTFTTPAVSYTAGASNTLASVPHILSLTFPIVSAGTPCASGRTWHTGGTIPVPQSSTDDLTSVSSTANLSTITSVASASAVNTSRPLFVNSTSETSFPFSIPPISSVLSVASSIIESLSKDHNSTTTTTTVTTVTLSGNTAIVDAASSTLTETTTTIATVSVLPVNSVLSAASSLLSGASSEISTKTLSTAVTVTANPIESVLSAASSELSIATSEISTKPSNEGTRTVTVVTTILETATANAAAPPTPQVTEINTVHTFTQTVPKFINTTSTSTVYSTVSAVGYNTSDTILSIDSATVFLPTTLTAGGPVFSVVSSLSSVPVFTMFNSSSNITSQTLTASTSLSATTSTALPLYNPNLTGGASSTRVPGIFGMLTRFLMLFDFTKMKTLVGAANAGIPVISLSAPTSAVSTVVAAISALETVTASPASVSPAVSVSISVSTTIEPCNLTSTPKAYTTDNVTANTTITLSTTVNVTSTVFSTLTATLLSAMPVMSAPQLNDSTVAILTIPVGTSAPFPSLNATSSSGPFGTGTITAPGTARLTPTSFGLTSTSTETTWSSTLSVTKTMSATPLPTSAVGRLTVKTVGALLLLGLGAWFVL